jgi:hypothetical protein
MISHIQHWGIYISHSRFSRNLIPRHTCRSESILWNANRHDRSENVFCRYSSVIVSLCDEVSYRKSKRRGNFFELTTKSCDRFQSTAGSRVLRTAVQVVRRANVVSNTGDYASLRTQYSSTFVGHRMQYFVLPCTPVLDSIALVTLWYSTAVVVSCMICHSVTSYRHISYHSQKAPDSPRNAAMVTHDRKTIPGKTLYYYSLPEYRVVSITQLTLRRKSSGVPFTLDAC